MHACGVHIPSSFYMGVRHGSRSQPAAGERMHEGAACTPPSLGRTESLPAAAKLA